MGNKNLKNSYKNPNKNSIIASLIDVLKEKNVISENDIKKIKENKK